MARHYGLDATASELPSYIDQNFLVRTRQASRYVLKVANSDEDPSFLDAQVRALEHLGSGSGTLKTPRLVRCLNGGRIASAGNHAVWLITFVSGRPLAELSHPSPALLRKFGRGLGGLDARLASFSHPGLHRHLRWDLVRAAETLELTADIEDAAGRDAVRRRLSDFAAEVLPVLRELPAQPIHNDANDRNVLIEGGGDSMGLVDFGDLVLTARVCEPAIAMAYAMMGPDDPLRVGKALLAGYHEALPLEEAEIRLVPDLIAARLCVSVTLSAHERRRDPDNDYVAVSEASAWRLLERLSAIQPEQWVATFAHAVEDVQ